MKIITNISDIVVYKLDTKYNEIAEQLQEVTVRSKSLELDLLILEKKKMELEWELQKIEKQITTYILTNN